jgi:uncharacterized protein (TIGR03435 family)
MMRRTIHGFYAAGSVLMNAVGILTVGMFAPALLPAQGRGGPPIAPQTSAVDQSTGEITFRNITMKELILRAYRIASAQLRGPTCLDTSRLDVDAKTPPGARQDQVLQNFLTERFKVALRRQNRRMKVYVLKVAEGGAKLDPTPAWDKRPGECVQKRGDTLCRSTPTGELAWLLLSQYLPSINIGPVIDRTGLIGIYDFKLEPRSANVFHRTGIAANSGLTLPGVSPLLDMRRQLKPLGLTIDEQEEAVDVLKVIHCERLPGE